ncbi:MAG: glycosyltransferase [Chitinophagaceae bacterium]|nr:glycosyltransferase [Chitinophagaceae bacterium]
MDNIVIWVEDELNGWGGVAAYAKQMAKRLSNKGAKTYFKSSGKFIEWHNDCDTNKSSSLLHFFVTNRNSLLFLQYVPYSFSRWGLPFHLWFYLLIAKLFQVNVQVYIHEVAIRTTRQPWEKKILGKLQLILAKVLCLIADRSFTSNQFYANMIGSGKSVFVIPVPSNIDKVPYQNNDRKIHRVCSFLNRATNQLFAALANLKDKGIQLELYLIGYATTDHQERAKVYQATMSYPIQIIPPLNEIALSELLSSASVYVQLESVDSFGEGGASTKSGALAAAFQHGKIIVTTKGDMTDNVYINEQTVFFVNPNEDGNIADTIELVLKDNKQAETRGRNAQKMYEEHMSWDRVIKKMQLI